MGRRKKYGQGLQTIFLIAVLTAAIVFLFIKAGGDRDLTQYSDRQVAAAEAAAQLGFGVYAQEDWEAWFETFHKSYLTKGTVSRLLEKLGVAEYIEVPGATGVHVMTRAEWSGIYDQILDYLDMEQEVKKHVFLVLGVLEADKENVLTTNGEDIYTRLPVTYFENWNAYEAYMIEEKCVGLVGISEEETDIENVYLKDVKDGTAEFLYAGNAYTKEIGETESGLSPGVCDLVFSGGAVISVRVKQDTINGGLLSYDDSTIEIEGYGKIAHDGKVPVYQTYGEAAEKSLSDVILGNMEVDYVTGEKKVCAILIRQPASIENIRVLLLAEDGGKFWQEAFLKCSSEAVLKCGETEETVAGDTLLAAGDYLKAEDGGTLTLTPSAEDGQIFLCDSSGNRVSNGYSGDMEVRKPGQGYTFVNQLPFETYLCAVVPSEMPSSYGMEAQKAQAVCARSYAYIQLLRADLAEYGAHIDDSTSYQVYNKVAPTESSIKAVQETAGQVMTYRGETIEAYYFSTSMGYTETPVIWNVEDLEKYGYLKTVCLNETPYEGDLSDEEDFLAYISQKGNGFDSGIRFYRWSAVADYREKTQEISRIVEERRAVSPKNIIYYEADGTTECSESVSAADMGQLIGIEVLKRSGGGSILTLGLTFEKGSVHVMTEYNIRRVLSCGVDTITYADGSEGAASALLPSAFCAVTVQGDGTVLLTGGGYGHGLGMSQNGADGMAGAGMGYEDILHYFYNDIEIGTVGQMSG